MLNRRSFDVVFDRITIANGAFLHWQPDSRDVRTRGYYGKPGDAIAFWEMLIVDDCSNHDAGNRQANVQIICRRVCRALSRLVHSLVLIIICAERPPLNYAATRFTYIMFPIKQ